MIQNSPRFKGRMMMLKATALSYLIKETIKVNLQRFKEKIRMLQPTYSGDRIQIKLRCSWSKIWDQDKIQIELINNILTLMKQKLQ